YVEGVDVHSVRGHDELCPIFLLLYCNVIVLLIMY
ncbi:uncharacterized protein METZ01_LOCUS95349, partial [marine metagenome]